MHFFHAHRYEDAWSYARVAADRARGKYALVDAGALYRRAIDAARSIPGIPAREIAEVHESRGDLLDRLGAYDEAAASYRAARRLVGGDPLAESKLYLKEAWISDRVGHYRQGLRWVTRGRQALEGVDGQEAGRQRARLSAWYAALRQGQGRYREVMAWCELAIKEAEASGEREALAQAYFILDWALVDLGRAGGGDLLSARARDLPRARQPRLGRHACSTTWACSRTSEGGGTRPSTSISKATTCGSRSATPSTPRWDR